MTLTEYLITRQESFDEIPFTPPDSLVLSALAYLNMDAYAHANVTGNARVPLVDILRFTQLEDLLPGGWISEARELPQFLEAVARSRRFADLAVSFYANESAAAIEKQFCACTFSVHMGCAHPMVYLAFRGTDGTLAGWKEDFNLSYRTVIPSQITATRYVSGVLSAFPAAQHVIVGGHSKGGNLAEYAAATIDEAGYSRIDRIFNHDGPSFLKAPGPRMARADFLAKLHKTVPESSIFGMILEHRDDYLVVQSDATGPYQHKPFTWIVEGADFAYQEELNASARLFDTTLDRWLRSCTPEQRECFIDTVYELIVSSDATSWKQFQESLPANLALIAREGRNLDAKTKEGIALALRNLAGVANETARERMAAVINRMRTAVSDARPPRVGIDQAQDAEGEAHEVSAEDAACANNPSGTPSLTRAHGEGAHGEGARDSAADAPRGLADTFADITNPTIMR